MYIDSHAHYDDSRYDNDRFSLLTKMEKGDEIDYIFNIGADIQSSHASVDLALRYDFIYAVVGVHPHEVKAVSYSDLDKIEELYEMANQPKSKKGIDASQSENLETIKKVVAIGEIGLDYYYDNSPRDIQQIWFQRQLNLAKKLKLPVVIHSRDALTDTYDILKESGVTKGVIHCYSYSLDMAKKFIELGFSIGIGGTSTFKNAKKTVEVIQNIDIEHIMLETDCPYLSPEPRRGTRNESLNLKYICEKVAELKDMSAKDVAFITSQNTLKVYGLN